MRPRTLLRAVGLGCLSLGLMGFEPGTAHYRPPRTDIDPPPLSRTVDKPVETVWGALIENASDNGYVVTDRDEQSGILTLRFGTLEPWEFVTGGHYRQTDATEHYNDSWTRDGAVVTFRGDYVEFASKRRGGRFDGSARVKVEALGPEKSQVQVSATYEYTMSDVRWSFETGRCARMLVPDARPDTPLERIMCPTHAAERQLLELAAP